MTVQTKADDNSLAVFLNGFGYVTTEFKTKGDGIILVEGIAQEAAFKTLTPILDSKQVEFSSARIVEATTLEDLARQNIGETVNGVDSGTHTLLGTIGNLGIVSRESSKRLAKLKNLIFPKGDYHDQGIELDLKNTPDNARTIQAAYLVNRINLEPHYNITIKGDKVVVKAQINIENQSGKSYDDVAFTVIPSQVNKPSNPQQFIAAGGHHREIRRIVSEECLLMSDSVNIEEDSTGQRRYTFGKRTIHKGKSEFALFTTKELDYKIKHSTRLSKGDCTVNTVLQFKAPDLLHMGSVAVSSQIETKDGMTEQYEGGGNFPQAVLKEKNASVHLRNPDTLQVKVEQIGETELIESNIKTPEGAAIYEEVKQYKVTATNGSQTDTTIESHLNDISAIRKMTSSSIPPSENKGYPRWDLAIPAGEEVSFTYKVKSRLLKELTYEEKEAYLKK